jgi:hypothetical protein
VTLTELIDRLVALKGEEAEVQFQVYDAKTDTVRVADFDQVNSYPYGNRYEFIMTLPA